MKRALLALALLTFAAWQAQAWPRGSVSTGGGGTPLASFLATLSNDQWGQPSNASAVASNIFYSTGFNCTTYSALPCSTPAPDYSSATASNNTGDNTAEENWDTWAGGAYDTYANRIIVQGGGHFTYCGNESYAFDIGQLTAYRIRTPDDFVTESTIPVSSGTYNNSTGLVTLTVPTNLDPFGEVNGYPWILSLTGSGASSLDGTFNSTNPYNSTTISFQESASLGSISITGGTIHQFCSQQGVTFYINGDPGVNHPYDGLVYLPPTATGAGTKGSLAAVGDYGTHTQFLYDLNNGQPYHTLSTALGLWTQQGSGAHPATPALSVFDPIRQRIYTENSVFGGGPPAIYYVDLATGTYSTAGMTGANQGLPNNGSGSYFSGTIQTGHDLMVGFGSTGIFSPVGNAMRVSLADGSQTVWSLTNYGVLPTTDFPGVCYAPVANKIIIWGGGTTLIEVDGTSYADTTYSTTEAVGVTVPPVNTVPGGYAGVMTKMVCDETDHIIVLWYKGTEAPFILKTSHF